MMGNNKRYSKFHATAADYVLAALQYGSCKASVLAYDMDITRSALGHHLQTLRKRGHNIRSVGTKDNYFLELLPPFTDSSPVPDAEQRDRYVRRNEGLG